MEYYNESNKRRATPEKRGQRRVGLLANAKSLRERLSILLYSI